MMNVILLLSIFFRGPQGGRKLEFLRSFIIIIICKQAFYHDCCNLLLSILSLEGH